MIYDKFPDLLNPEFAARFDFEGCWTRLHPEGPIGELDAAVALLVTRAHFGRAAKMLGRSRRALEGFVLRNLSLRDLYEDIREEFLDDVAHSLGDIALKGHAGACQFILQNLGRDRGFMAPATTTPNAPVRDEMSLDELMEEARKRGLPVEGLI